MPTIATFQGLLEKGPDSSLLRYSLANAFVSESQHDKAIEHLVKALEFDQDYSAAWKLLGRCYLEVGDLANAEVTYEKGIKIADAKGDKQAAKEMGVFLKRVVRNLD